MPIPSNVEAAVAEQSSERLLRWEELREQGQPVTPEELCADCPELIEDLKRKIRAIESMEAMLGMGQAASPVQGRGSEPSYPMIPGHQVLGMLGQGGMGIVYKARQTALDRLVAIKMILAGPYARPDQLARFRTEAEAVAQLQHPNIVHIHDVGECAGQPYFSMELIEGENLAQRLTKGPLAARQAASLVATLADAVQHAHQHSILHRDLKPSNILLQVTGDRLQVGGCRSLSEDRPRAVANTAKPSPISSLQSATGNLQPVTSDLQFAIPKITDFGLAKWLAGAPRPSADAALTATGAILGTPSYLAPEQASSQGQEIGPAADIYALGAILYEALTGRPPFQAETALDTLEQVRLLEPVPPSRLQPKVPLDLATICLKCLHKEPQRRYSSAGALADDLRRFLANEPILARPTPLWEKGIKWTKRRPALAALVGVSGVAVAALLGTWIGLTAALRGERDRARQQQQRAEAILGRSLAAVDRHAQITEVTKGGMAASGRWEPGRFLVDLARAYAVTSATYLKDSELSREDRARFADQYAARAVKLLDNARAAGYLTAGREQIHELKENPDFEPLRGRQDFQKLLADLEEKGEKD